MAAANGVGTASLVEHHWQKTPMGKDLHEQVIVAEDDADKGFVPGHDPRN